MHSWGLFKVAFEERQPIPEGICGINIFKYTFNVSNISWVSRGPSEMVIVIKMVTCPLLFTVLSSGPSSVPYICTEVERDSFSLRDMQWTSHQKA